MKEQKKIIESRKIKEKKGFEEKEVKQEMDKEQIKELTETIDDLTEKYRLL